MILICRDGFVYYFCCNVTLFVKIKKKKKIDLHTNTCLSNTMRLKA